MNWTTSAAIYCYFVMVGTCYLLGFWTPLHFNILEFLSPTDILKAATYPIIPAALGVFFYVLMDSYNSQGTKPPEDNAPDSMKYLFWVIIILFATMLLINISSLAIHVYFLFTSEPEKRLLFALPVATFVGIIYFINNPPFMEQSSKLARNFIIIFACVLPTTAHFQGDKNIKKILDGEASYYKLKESSKNCRVTKGSDNIYLGNYGDRYIFINSANRDVCIESDHSILLAHHIYETPIAEDPMKEDISKAASHIDEG